jgi:gliding motility-associated-like protein
VTVTDDDGLTASDIAHVTVSQKELIPPIISIMNDATINTSQELLTISAEAFDDGEVISTHWEQILGPPVAIPDPASASNDISGWRQGTYEFRFTAVDNDGLSSSESVIIQVFDENAEGNAFPMKLITPNGDYDNERWILDPDISKFATCTLVIYNRHGQEVYNVTGYSNEWNATMNGEELEEGVYYYFLKCDEDDNAILTGSITVIR